MATPPDFSPGQVLTAAHMDAVGLWLVKTQTVGTGVSSVTVTGAFSDQFDNYRIIYSGGTQSTSTDVVFQLGSSTTGYSSFLNYGVAGTSSPLGASQNNAASFPWVGGAQANQASHASLDVLGPYLTGYTKIRNAQYQNLNIYGTCQGEHAVSASYTSFTLSVGAGTMTGGTIRVYGYRN